MKKKIFFIVFILLLHVVVNVWGQPNPNDVGYGAGNAAPVGGGAELGHSLFWLIFISLIYTFHKFRLKILYWFISITS